MMQTKKLSITLVMAMLISTFAIFPITPVAQAAVVTPKITLDYPYATVNNFDIMRYIVVENPMGNPDITEIRLYIPKEAVSAETSPEVAAEGGFPATATPAFYGSGPWTVIISLPEGGILLPDGAAGKIELTFDNTGVEVGKYKLTATAKFADGSSRSVDLYLYEGEATQSVVDITTTGPVKAGSKVEGTIELLDSTGKVVDEAVPILVWAVNPDSKTVIVGTFTTSAGEASFTYYPTKAGDWIFYADAAEEFEATGAILEEVEDTINVIPEAPTQVKVYTQYDPEGEYAVNYLVDSTVEVWAAVTDKYGNPVTMDVDDVTVTFTAPKGSWAGGHGSNTAPIPQRASESGHVNYVPASTYGTSVTISAKVEVPSETYKGTYIGYSPELITSCFAQDFWITIDKSSVKAGEYATITVQLNYLQKGVPVKFSVTEEGYGGSFVPSTAYTDSSGKVEVKFYVNTTAESVTTVKVTVSKPLTEDPDNVLECESDEIETIPGDPVLLVVKTYEDSSYNTPKAVVKPKGTLYVVVSLRDAYGNVAENTFEAVIQINLAVDFGSLSTTTAYIAPGFSATGGMLILYTAPATSGIATITASSPQAGLASGSCKVTVAGPEPIVTITSPAKDLKIASNKTVSMNIAGYAEVSPAQPTGTSIILFEYSLDGAENVTAPRVKLEAGKYYFNFTVSLEPNATHAVTVYAHDSSGKVGFATRSIEVTLAPIYPATVSKAKSLDAAGSPKTSFHLGETVIVSANISNVDTVSHSMLIAVQVKDPDGTVLPTQYVIVTLAPGQSIAPALSSIIPSSGYRAGTWNVKIMVLSNWPAQGGVSIAEPVEITFTVTG
jgi:hypothetical protein